jgi:hypothetical protein
MIVCSHLHINNLIVEGGIDGITSLPSLARDERLVVDVGLIFRARFR